MDEDDKFIEQCKGSGPPLSHHEHTVDALEDAQAEIERLKAGIRKGIETCHRREAFNGPNPHVTEISLMLHGLLLKGEDDGNE